MSTGTFKAKLEAVGIKAISTGSTVIVAQCRCFDGDKSFVRTKDLFLTDGAKPYTFDALNTMGYLFLDDDMCDVDDLSAYDRSVEFEVVVESEFNEKDGKSYEKIKFVNPLGGREIKGTIAKEEKVSHMKGLNLAGDVMGLRDKYGKKGAKKTEQTTKPAEAPEFTADDLPF